MFYTNVFEHRNKIYETYYDNGRKKFKEIEFAPSLFIKTNEPTEWKTIFGDNAKEIQFPSIKAQRDYIKKWQDVEGFDIFNNISNVYKYIASKYKGILNFQLPWMEIVALDIETSIGQGFPDPYVADQDITVLTMYSFKTKTYWVYVNSEYGSYKNVRENAVVIHCKNDEELLVKFIAKWKELNIDIVTGWNTNLFDIPFIINRIARLFGQDFCSRLSPFGFVQEKESFDKFGKEVLVYDIKGITSLDYIDLYKKFRLINRESYKLDFIANIELGTAKVDYSEFSSLKEFYQKDFNKFVEYNIVDVELIPALEGKLKYIELALTIAYIAKVNIIDILGTISVWDSLIFNYLIEKNIVIPPKKESTKSEKFVGAYVKEPVPNLYDWVVSYDLESLYPKIIMQWNISPETLTNVQKNVTIDKMIAQEIDTTNVKNKNLSIAANGTMFRKDKIGVIPTLIENIFNDRKKYKKMYQEYEKVGELIKLEKKKRGLI